MSYYKGSGYGGSRGSYRGGSSSYRGGGSGDSSWRGGRGSSFSSSRPVGSSSGGSSRYYASSPPSSSYDSRSRSSYVGGSGGGTTSSGDRYSSSNRRDDSYSRYPEISSSYGSRDYGRGSSPEPSRKRVRGDSPAYMGGRRSHERSFSTSGGGSGADYSSSRVGGSGGGSFYDKGSSSGTLGGGYLSEKGTYREVRESRPPHHAPPATANDYPPFRKPSFPSPRGGGSAGGIGGFRASRRGLRSSRGIGGSFRPSSAYLSRKRLADSFHLRRRGLTSRTSYLRRLKQYRLLKRHPRVSERRRRITEDGQDGEHDDDKSQDEEMGEEDDDEVIEVGESSQEDEEEEEEEEDEDDDEEEEEEDDEGEEEAEEGAEGEVTKDEEASKDAKEAEEGEVEGGEGEEKDKEGGNSSKEGAEEKESKDKEAKDSSKEGSSSPKKVVKKKKKVVAKKTKTTKTSESKEGKKAAKDESGGEEKDGEKKHTLTNFLGHPYIKLRCPHCHFACVTFKEYSRHLGTAKHLAAMSTLSAKLRKTFVTMRLDQRKMQKVLDEEAKSVNSRLRTLFCSICKLNYRTLKSQHQSSLSHRKMKEFQSPYCRVCRITYKSAWAYEQHVCELQHIKRKARLERLSKPPGSKDLDNSDINLDTNNFMVLDAVGSGDDSEGEKSDNEEKGEKSEETKDKSKLTKEKKKKKEIKLGSEFCKLVEVYFCELCKIYLPRLDDKDRALTVHCRSRTHLQRYIRSRDDRTLRRKAVRLHKEREKLKEKAKEKKTSKDDSKSTDENSAEKMEEGGDDKATKDDSKEGENEDKAWSEVDKDLSCLLNEEEVSSGKQRSDEDDEEEEDDEESKEGERYDRFKHSEKDKLKDESLAGSPVIEKQTSANKAKSTTSGSTVKEDESVDIANTANGSISSAEKKKIEAAE